MPSHSTSPPPPPSPSFLPFSILILRLCSPSPLSPPRPPSPPSPLCASYDYDAPIDEYGYPHDPKYSHTTALHDVLSKYSSYLLGVDVGTNTQLNSYVDVWLYGSGQGGLAFVSNINDAREFTVHYAGKDWTLPAWSVTLVDVASLQVLYCTANISSPSLPLSPTPSPSPFPVSHPMATMGLLEQQQQAQPQPPTKAVAYASTISYIREPIGISSPSPNKSNSPPEAFSVTNDTTDFLWHQTTIQLTAADLSAGYFNLTLSDTNEFVYVYFDSQPVVVAFAKNVGRPTRIQVPLGAGVTGRGAGAYLLQLLVVTMGLQNCCGGLEGFTRGIEGRVMVGEQDITNNGWLLQRGLKGESEGYVAGGGGGGAWMEGVSPLTPLTWYKLSLTSPTPTPSPLPSWQLDLAGMGKGLLWFNGHCMGRYWDIVATQGTCPEVCDYRGSYGDGKCRYDCGLPSLRLYHIPRSWLKPVGEDNEIIVLEERGGDPATIALLQRN